MTHQDTDVDTDYHKITKPAFEKDEWDHDYYNFVDQVDANLKLSGTVANRPAASETPDDAWYEATDQNLVYRNDSTEGWIVIGGSGTEQDPVPEGYYDSINTGEAVINSRKVYIQPTEPSGGEQGDVWIDTSNIE